MPTRRRVFQVIAAILAAGARAQDFPSQAQLAAAARADFIRKQNEFANEFNRLFQDLGQLEIWNVKRARQVAKLFEKLTADPSYRI